MSATLSAAKPVPRILSMDQFRGYAIFGMLLVDYFGLYKGELLEPGKSTDVIWFFAHLWQQIHHPHEAGFTFADLIAPVFMFVVGMGMRLSMLRRIPKVGLKEARWSIFKRYGILVMLGFTIYTGYLWDALLNIGLAGLIVVWFVDKKPWQRFLCGVGLVAAFQSIFLFTSYGQLVMWKVSYNGDNMPLFWKLFPIGPELVKIPINGGPLGHWSWALILIAGTIGYDIIRTQNTRKITLNLLGWGVGLCVLGLLLQAEWGSVKEAWPISKNWTTAPYAFWSAGLCFLNLLIFYYICDVWNWNIPTLSVLGINPLAIYVIHWCICESAHRFVPDTSPWAFIFIGWFVFYGLCYGIARYMYEKNILIKI